MNLNFPKHPFKSIGIDYSQFSIRREIYRASKLNWLFLLISACLCIFTSINLIQYKMQGSELDEKIRHLQAVGQAEVRNTKAPLSVGITAEQKIAANAIIDQLNFPWSDLLDELEDAQSFKVALLLLEPNEKSKNILLQAEASDIDQMLDYLQYLKKSNHFSQLRLLKYEIRELEPNKPVRFQFEVKWAKS